MDRDGLSRKRTRKGRDGEDEEGYNESINDSSIPTVAVEQRLFDFTLPKEWEAEFASAIFELGLTYSSPKVIIPLMPTVAGLNTEHIKSHLQKYRIHKPRSKEEFLAFYERYLKDSFSAWEKKRGWECSNDRQARTTSPNHAHANPLGGPGLILESSSSISTHILAGDHNHSKHLTNDDQDRVHKKLRKLYDLEQLLIRSNSLLQEWKVHTMEILESNSDLRQELTAAAGLLNQNPMIVHATSLAGASNVPANVSVSAPRASNNIDFQAYNDPSDVNYGFTGTGDM